MSIILTTEFARSCRFADPVVAGAAQVALANRTSDQHVLEALAANVNLHPDAARALIARKLPAKVACDLVARVASDIGLRSAVLQHERRDPVLAALVENCDDADFAALVLGKGPRTRTAISANRRLPLDLRVNAARAGSELWARLRVAADCTDEVISDDEIWSWLTDETVWPRRRSPRDDVSHILWIRPALLDRIAGDNPPQLVTSAAGSVYLDDSERFSRVLAAARHHAISPNGDQPWALLALIANPRVDTSSLQHLLPELKNSRHLADQQMEYRSGRPAVKGPFHEVPGSSLRWLTSRAFPGQYHDGRPAEALSLLGHPDLAEHRHNLLEDLLHLRTHHPAWKSELDDALCVLDPSRLVTDYIAHDEVHHPEFAVDDISAELMTERLQTRLYLAGHLDVAAFCQYGTDQLGADRPRWETFWSILPDLDHDLRVGEVVDLAAHL
jgi:hypothetical protein